MAERAHPDEPGFQDRWLFRLRKGIIPWISKLRSPYRAAFMWRYNWVSRYCSNKDVVDVPCGMGWGTSLIRGTRSIIGYDLSPEAVSEAKSRYGNTAKFAVGDMGKLDLPDESVDVVSCLEGIEHVPMDVGQRFMAEAHRVLRPGGRLLISSPYCRTAAHSGNPYHIHEYQPDEIHSLINGYFKIENCERRDVDVMAVLYLTCKKTQ